MLFIGIQLKDYSRLSNRKGSDHGITTIVVSEVGRGTNRTICSSNSNDAAIGTRIKWNSRGSSCRGASGSRSWSRSWGGNSANLFPRLGKCKRWRNDQQNEANTQHLVAGSFLLASFIGHRLHDFLKLKSTAFLVIWVTFIWLETLSIWRNWSNGTRSQGTKVVIFTLCSNIEH